MKTITFDPEPDIAEKLQTLSQVVNLGAGDLINVLLRSPLSQIVDDHDCGLLRPIFQSFEYDTKEEALAVIASYEGFISEDASRVYHPDAKPARTRDGHWEILFKSTHLREQGAALD
jgi:hypothetical protein